MSCSYCSDCSSSSFLKNCIFCKDLHGIAETPLEFYVFNEKVTKEEFEALLKQAKEEGLI